MEYGTAKTQKLPYSYWGQLRGIETGQELADFFNEYQDFFRAFLQKRTSSGKIEDIFQRGKIKDNSEFDFLCEATKSAIFRAGGTNIMDWGCWYQGDSKIEIEPLSSAGVETVPVYGLDVELPLGYSVGIPKELYMAISDVTMRIHQEVRTQINGPKLLTRVDYIIADGGYAYIIDIGESNTTLGLADSIFAFSGRQSSHLLERYIRAVLEQQCRLAPGFNRVLFVAENLDMVKNLSYEFETMARMINCLGVEASTIVREDLHSAAENAVNTAFVRCFRGIPAEYESTVKMVDDLSAIAVYDKSNLYAILERIKAILPEQIKVPFHLLFPLHKSQPDELADSIISAVKEAGLKDYVVKPAVKSKKASSLAYLYSSDNPIHKRQLRKTITRFDEEAHIPSLIIEENIGSAAADGKKLEVRVHCLSE